MEIILKNKNEVKILEFKLRYYKVKGKYTRFYNIYNWDNNNLKSILTCKGKKRCDDYKLNQR